MVGAFVIFHAALNLKKEYGSISVKHDYIENPLAKPEYHEGTKAAAAFVQLGRALFQAPKTVLTKKPKKAAKKTVRPNPEREGLEVSACPVPVGEWGDVGPSCQ